MTEEIPVKHPSRDALTAKPITMQDGLAVWMIRPGLSFAQISH